MSGKEFVSKLVLEAESRGLDSIKDVSSSLNDAAHSAEQLGSSVNADELRSLADQIKALAKSGTEASPALESLESSLRSLADQQSAVDSFVRLKRSTADLTSQLDSAQTEIDGLSLSLEEAAKASNEASAAEQASAQRVAEAKQYYEQLKDAVAKTHDELNEYREAAHESGDSTGEYAQKISEAETQLKVLNTETKASAKSLKELKDEHAENTKAARAATDAHTSLGREYDTAVKSAGGLSAKLGEQNAALDDARTKIHSFGGSTTDLTATQEKLQTAIAKTASEVKQITNLSKDRDFLGLRSHDAVQKEINETRAAYERLKDSGKLTKKELAQAAVETEKKIRSLKKETGEMSESVKKANKETSSLFSSMKTKLAGIATLIGGYFSARTFLGAINSAKDFEQALSRVQAVSGATAEEMATLQAAAEEAGTNTKYTATQAANALEELTKAGLSATDAVSALPAVLNLAQAGGVELAQAATYITSAVNGMGLAFEDSARVADVLAMGANATMTSVEGLASAFGYAAPVAQSLGLTLEETVTYLGKLADAGIDASRSGTALNNMMSQFKNPASTFRAALAGAGITTSDFNQAIRQLAEKEGPAAEKAILAVGLNAGPALRALLNQGAASMDTLLGQLQNAEGSAAATAAVMEKNLKGALTGLGSAWDAVRRGLVAPLLEPLAEQVNSLAKSFRDAVNDKTIESFGVILKDAFVNAANAAKEFIASFDLKAIISSFRDFASRAGETFTQVAGFVSTTTTIVKTAFNTMSAGFNLIMHAIYGVSRDITFLFAGLLTAFEKLSLGLSKITFGDVSKKFKEDAEKIRDTADGLFGVVDDLNERMQNSFDKATDSATNAKDGFMSLVGAGEAAGASIDKVTSASSALETSAKNTEKEIDGLEKRIAELNKTADGFSKIGFTEGARKTKNEIADLQKEIEALKKSLDDSKGGFNSLADEITKTKNEIENLERAAEVYSEAGFAEKAAETKERVAELRMNLVELEDSFAAINETSKTSAEDIEKLKEEYLALMVAGDTEGAAKIAEKIISLGVAAGDASDDVSKLKEEYQRLIDQGDLQGAAAILEQIKAIGTTSSDATLQVSNLKGSIDTTSEASRAAAEQVRILKEEYDRLISEGDLQGGAGIAEKIREIQKSAQESQGSISGLTEVLGTLGIQSDEALKQTADGFRLAYEETVKMGGSVREVRESFSKYADAAIKANGGVADAALKAQAQQHGVQIVTDATGKSVVKMAEGTQQAGESGKQMAEGMQQATEATEQAGEASASAGGIAAKMAEALDAEAASIANISGAAGEAVEALRTSGRSFQEVTEGISGLSPAALLAEDGLKAAEQQVVEFGQQADGAAAQAENLRASLVDTAVDWKPFKEQLLAMEELKERLYRAKQAAADLDVQVERFNRNVDDGNLTLEQQEGHLQQLIGLSEEYGTQHLTTLKSELDDVRQKMISLKDDAQSALDAVQDEIDQMTGNAVAIEERRQQAKIKELEAKLAEAQASGNRETAEIYQKTIAEQKKLQTMKIEEARLKQTEERQQKRNEKQSSRGSSGGSESISSTKSNNNGRAINLNIDGNTYPVQTNNDVAEQLVRELARSRKVSSIAKIR